MNEPQDYEVIQFKKGDFQDVNGNFWCDMALKGVGEPVRIVVKDPLQFHDGMTLYGHITEETSKAGKQYLRFRRDKKEEQTSFAGSTRTDKPDDQYWEDKNSAIKAQWAIGQAIQLYIAEPKKSETNTAKEVVENLAKDLYAMVDRVKGSSESADPKETGSQTTPESTQTHQKSGATTGQMLTSGYEKFKASKPVVEEEFASMLAKGMEADGIDMSEIPF